MSLKFHQVDWDDRHLMYVEFISNGHKLRWYPKWKEVDDIVHCSWLTERGYRDGRFRDYFDIISSEILLKGLLRRLASSPDCALTLPEADIAISEIFRTLRGVFTRESDHAKA